MSSTATTRGTGKSPTAGRWWIVVAALLLQFAIGAVYAWSVFGKALASPDAMNLSPSQASLTFTVTIGMIFTAATSAARCRTAPDPARWR